MQTFPPEAETISLGLRSQRGFVCVPCAHLFAEQQHHVWAFLPLARAISSAAGCGFGGSSWAQEHNMLSIFRLWHVSGGVQRQDAELKRQGTTVKWWDHGAGDGEERTFPTLSFLPCWKSSFVARTSSPAAESPWSSAALLGTFSFSCKGDLLRGIAKAHKLLLLLCVKNKHFRLCQQNSWFHSWKEFLSKTLVPLPSYHSSLLL